jgi:hypothetical protein
MVWLSTIVRSQLKNTSLPLSHGGNTGSNPVGDASKIKQMGF